MKTIPIIDVESKFFGIYGTQERAYPRHIYFFDNGHGAMVNVAPNPLTGDDMTVVHELTGNIENYKYVGGHAKKANDDDELREILERIKSL